MGQMRALEHLKTPYYREYRTLIREKMCTTEPPYTMTIFPEQHPFKGQTIGKAFMNRSKVTITRECFQVSLWACYPEQFLIMTTPAISSTIFLARHKTTGPNLVIIQFQFKWINCNPRPQLVYWQFSIDLDMIHHELYR